MQTFTGSKRKRKLVARILLQYCQLPDIFARDVSKHVLKFSHCLKFLQILAATLTMFRGELDGRLH